MDENMNRPAGDPILSAKEALAQALAAAEAALNRAEQVRGGAQKPETPETSQPAAPAAPVQQQTAPVSYAQRPAAPAPQQTAPAAPVQQQTAPVSYAQRPAAPAPQQTAAPAAPVQQQTAPVSYAQRPAAPAPQQTAPAAPVQQQTAPINYAQRPATPVQQTTAQQTVQRQPAPINYAQRPAAPVQQQTPAPAAPVQRHPVAINYAQRPAAPAPQAAPAEPVRQKPVQRPAGPNPLLARHTAPVQQQTAPSAPVQQKSVQRPAGPNPLLSRPAEQIPGVPTADMIAQVFQIPEKKPEPETVQEAVQEAVTAPAPQSEPALQAVPEPEPAPQIAPEPEVRPEPKPAPVQQTAPSPAVTAPPQTETTAQTVSRRPWDPDPPETEAARHLQEQEKEQYTAKDFINDALDLVGSVLVSVFVVMLMYTYLFRVADVDGDSMVPTLQDGNKLLLTRIGRHYETGDILILNSRVAYTLDKDGNLKDPDKGLGKQIVKRLIAQGGQTVDIDFQAGIVYVDGKALDEPYVNTPTNRDEGGFTYPFTVPEGYVFVMGDNRYISLDSRSSRVGLIPTEDISGRVIWRILPFSGFGGVD